MKATHVLFFFCLNFQALQAQSYYQKIHINQGYNTQGRDVIIQNNHLVYTGITGWLEVDPQTLQVESRYGLQAGKTDQNGNILWNKHYSSSGANLISHTINKTSDGGFIITGYLESSIYTGPASYPLLLKINSQGSIQWISHKYHGTGFKGSVYSLNLSSATLSYAEENPPGNLIAIGTNAYKDNLGSEKHYTSILEVDASNGSILKEKIIELDHHAIGLSIKALPEEGYVALLRHAYLPNPENTAIVLRLDNNLNILWRKEYELDQDYLDPQDLIITQDNKIVVTGNVNIQNQLDKIFLMKLDMNGQQIWSKAIDYLGTWTNFIDLSLDEHTNGNLIISATVNSNSPFQSGSSGGFCRIITQNNGTPIKALSYDRLGNQEINWGQAVFPNGSFVSIGHIDYQNLLIITADPNGHTNCDYNELSAQQFEINLSDWSPNLLPYNYPLVNVPDHEIGAVELAPTVVDCPPIWLNPLKETGNTQNLETYVNEISPNPSSGLINLELSKQFDVQVPVIVQVINLHGQELKRYELLGRTHSLNLEFLEKGMYVLSFSQEKITDHHKIIIH